MTRYVKNDNSIIFIIKLYRPHCIEYLNRFLYKDNNIPVEIFTILNEEIEKHNLIRAHVKETSTDNYWVFVVRIYCSLTKNVDDTFTKRT